MKLAMRSTNTAYTSILFVMNFSRCKDWILSLLYPVLKLYWRVRKPHTLGAKALIVHNDHVLLVKPSHLSAFLLPGGSIKRNESPEACALREAYEETSLRVTVQELLGEYTSNQEGKRDTIYVYIAHLATPDTRIMTEWELQDAGWFALNALPSETSPATRRRIDEYLAGTRHLLGAW